MKRVGKLGLCLAGGLVLSPGLRAAGTLPLDNPYVAIVSRNIFDIHEPPKVDPNKEKIAAQLPKITVNGIISSYGHTQAMYKVAMPARPGVGPKEQFYTLGEGEAQDEVEVLKIDGSAGMVTFNNHGTEQELPLANATASTGPAPAAAAPAQGAGPRPGFPRLGGFPPAGGAANNAGIIRFGQTAAPAGATRAATGGNNANNTGANPPSRLGVMTGGSSGIVRPQQQPVELSGDDQAVMVAARHAIALGNGDPTAQIYPPTEHDEAAGIPPTPTPTPGGSAPQ